MSGHPCHRRGTTEGGGLTLEEIEKRFGVTRELACAIEVEALGGLRRPRRPLRAESARSAASRKHDEMLR